MIRKSARITLEVVSIVSILTMLAAVSFFIWVMLAPRSLTFVTPYIEKQLNSINHEYSIKIASSSIEWDRQQHAISIHARNIDIINDTKDTVATLPEISFGFSLLRFLRGNLFSSDLTIMHPSIHINTADKTLYVSRASDVSLQKIAFNSIYGMLGNHSIFKFHSVRVQDADIFLNNGLSDMLWKIDDGYAKLETVKKVTRIKSEFKVNLGKDTTYFSLNISPNKDNSISAEINFNNLPSYIFSEFFPEYGIEQKVNMIFTGQANLLITGKGDISQVRLKLDNADGTLNLPEMFRDSIEIKNLTLDATITDNLTNLTINNMVANFHGPVLKVSGNITNTKTWPEFIPSIDISASVDNLEIDDVGSYWPYKLGNVAWEWVTHNISDGMVKHAEGHFKFAGADIEKIIEREKSGIFESTPPIPEDAINATVNVERARVNYMEHFPNVNEAKATVKFTGHAMDAAVETAQILSTTVRNGHVTFDNLWQDHLQINISGNFAGPAEDAIPFLKASYKEKPENAEMAAIYNVKGESTGNINLSIPFKPGLKYDDIDIKIASNLKDTLLPGFVEGKNLLAINMEFSLDKYDINLKGDSAINGIPAKLEAHKNFSATSNPSDLEFKLKGAFSPAEIKELAKIDIPLISGKIGLDIDVKNKDGETTASGSADLAQCGVQISDFGFTKAPGKTGSLAFNVIKNSKEDITIKDFKAKGEGFDINGSGKLSAQTQSFSEISLTTAKFGSNDFTAKYTSSKNGDDINIEGKSIDLSGSKFSEWFRRNPAKQPTALAFSAKFGRALMKNGEALSDVNASLECTAKRCHTGGLYGKLHGDNFIVISLKNIGDRSALLVESDNAGAIINAFNISKNITGGHLNIDSSLGKRGDSAVANGVVKISEFTAIKTPLLGKILTLASFRGFEDLLENQGISFKKFEAPFTMANDIITVKNAKSSGASIGITSGGTINTAKDEVDLKGVIVPAYAVNNVIGKIPFVGKIIIGNEGEGVLATKYSITGPYDDVKVSVNPLSILTPGFLRNLFDIFDKPSKQ